MDENKRLSEGLNGGQIPINYFPPAISAPSKSMMIFIQNLESWEHLNDDEQKMVLDKITNLTPISSGCSLHICEERYVINGETYRTIEAIGHDGIMVEILKTKK